MTTDEALDILLQAKLLTGEYEALLKIVGDIKILEIFKKYFAGVSQDETGRWFIDMSALEGSDIALLIHLIEKGEL